MSKTKTFRVTRGGDHGFTRAEARRAFWCKDYIKDSYDSIGFRLAEEVEDPKTTLSVSRSDRVVRGSSWRIGLDEAAAVVVDGCYNNLGIRLVEVIDE